MRRATISPEAVGLINGSRRRTPGLRREEVALRANVGLTWYTWLEQGRDIQVSREVVDRIAEALNLSPSDKAYLVSLAGHEAANSERPRNQETDEVQGLLDGFTAGPAMLWNSCFDCIAYNRLADLIYEWSGSSEPFKRNTIWRMFMDPKRLQMYAKAERLMQDGVGKLRSRYASHLGEPDFEPLIKVLLDGSDLFKRLWSEQHTASVAPVAFIMTHPDYGELALRSVPAMFPPIPESTLLFVCPTDESTKSVFRRLID